MNPPFVSIVIPILHDAESLARLLPTLATDPAIEIIVVNGDGPDPRLAALIDQHEHVSLLTCPAGRGRQMNVGARAGHGRWFLFLHADTQIPSEWFEELQHADSDPAIVAGSFQFQLDSSAWQARVIERAVRWRVRWFDLAYGDQALFVRREAFRAVGGYREWPLMEDIDLIRRLRRVGRLYHSSLPAVTSARRWERDGWWRRTGENVLLQALFFAGASPAWLAQRYLHRAKKRTSREALVVMARAPSDQRGKSRLIRDLPSDIDDLRRAILLDTFDAIAGIRRADLFIAFAPDNAQLEFRSMMGDRAQLIPQRGDTLGDRMRNVFADVFERGYSKIVLTGSDLPTLPPAYVEQAFDDLSNTRNPVVLGPARDGGYYLIGLRELCPELFASIPWSTPGVLSSTIRNAERLHLNVSLTPEWYDVDALDDLRRALCETAAAPHTRAWVASHPGLVTPSGVSAATPETS